MNTQLFLAAALALSAPALHAQTAPATPAPAQAAPPPAASPAAPAVTLRYKFAVGQVHRYEYDMAMDMLMQTGQTGAGIPINMTMQMTMSQTVKSIRSADGAATLVTQIESMHMLRGGQEMPLPQAAQEKLKQPFTQVMLPTGKILSLDSQALNGMGGPGMDFGKGMFGSLTTLPDGPVGVGDTWSGSGAAPMMGFDVSSASALTDISRANGAAVATIQSKQTGTIDKTMTQGTPVPIKMHGKVTGQTVQTFDTSAGTIQSSKGTSSADMLMTFIHAAGQTPPPGMPSTMKMQMQMKFQMQRLSDTAAPAAPVQ